MAPPILHIYYIFYTILLLKNKILLKNSVYCLYIECILSVYCMFCKRLIMSSQVLLLLQAYLNLHPLVQK